MARNDEKKVGLYRRGNTWWIAWPDGTWGLIRESSGVV